MHEWTNYTTVQIAKAAGISYRRLDVFVRSGLITPAVYEGDGSGTQREWGQWQVGEIVEIMERRKRVG